MTPTRTAAIFIGILLLNWVSPLFAQPVESVGNAPQTTAGWQAEYGVGVIVNPDFQGADDYRVLPVPYIDLRYVDDKGVKYFANVPQGVGGWLVRQRSDTGDRRLDLGFALAPGFANRDEDDIAGLEDFGPALEARGYVRYTQGPWGLDATLAQAVASGHEGFYADISASRRGTAGRGGFWSFGPTIRMGDSTYNNALYGVTPAESAASGLPAYSAGSGIESVALQGLLSIPVSKNWRWTAIVRGGQLLNDRGDSPVVADDNQFFMLTALTRRF
ncbi:MAG: MipA/OmpV family protein [Lysobacterales bacterium]